MVILESIGSAGFRLPIILETAKRLIKPLKYKTTYDFKLINVYTFKCWTVKTQYMFTYGQNEPLCQVPFYVFCKAVEGLGTI